MTLKNKCLVTVVRIAICCDQLRTRRGDMARSDLHQAAILGQQKTSPPFTWENACRQSENIQTPHRSSCLRPRTHLVWSSNCNHCTAVASFKKAKKKINNFPIVNKRIKVKTELAFISSSSQVAGLYTVLSHTPFWGVSTVQKHPAQGSVLWDNLYSHSDNSHCCSDLIWLLIHANSLEVGRMTKHD